MKLLTLTLFSFSAASASRMSLRDFSGCNPQDNLGHLGAGKGDRKIAFVIDSSGSMADNDPGSLRLLAADLLLNSSLISKEKATNKKKPDLLTIIDFNAGAFVDYELGDPGKDAHLAILGIGAGGGTFIGDGVDTAVAELSKDGFGETKDRSGMVILTDGADDPTSNIPLTIAAIKSAGDKGIRVSMGYMAIVDPASEAPPDQDGRIHDAVISTGGLMIKFTNPKEVFTFLLAVAGNGLTNSDKGNAGDLLELVPGLQASAKLGVGGPNVFKYRIFKDETITLNLTALGNFAPLRATLREASANSDLETVDTNTDGFAMFKFKGERNMDLEIAITSSVADAKGIYIIGLVSDVDCSKDQSSSSTISSTTSLTTSQLSSTASDITYSSTAVSTSAPDTTITSSAAVTLPGPGTTNWTRPGPTETTSMVLYTGAASPKHVSGGMLGVGFAFGVYAAL